jgi:hypothetical protein
MPAPARRYPLGRRYAEERRMLTFCWRHSLHARFTAVLRRDDDGRVSPSFSCSSSLEAERLKPRVLVGLVGEMAKACCASPCVGLIDESCISS